MSSSHAGQTWSIFSQPNGNTLAEQYSAAVLRDLNAPVTKTNMQVIYDWQQSEGGGGWANPLNAGPWGNLATSGSQFGGGAAAYPNLQTSAQAVADILTAPGDAQYGYPAIVNNLRSGNSAGARQAIINSNWAASHYGYGASFSNAPLPSVGKSLLQAMGEGLPSAGGSSGRSSGSSTGSSGGTTIANVPLLGAITIPKGIIVRGALLMIGLFLLYAGIKSLMGSEGSPVEVVGNGASSAKSDAKKGAEASASLA